MERDTFLISDLMDAEVNPFGKFLNKIVVVYPVCEDDLTEMARLIKIRGTVLTFERKNGERFRIDERDIRDMEIFRSPYHTEYDRCEA